MTSFAKNHILPATEDYVAIACDQFKILGRSIAGVETIYAIAQWDLNLDIGGAPSFAVPQNHVALTHWHLDHAGSLAKYLGLRCLNGLPAAKIIVFDADYDITVEFLNVLKKASQSDIKFEVVKASSKPQLKRDLWLEPIAVSHCIQATGYGVKEAKRSLKEEFKNKSQAEIIAAKNAGVDINETTENLLLAYSGDSDAGFFESEATMAKVFIMECSFFSDDSDFAKIKHYGHTHIRDWAAHAEKIQSETVVMTHTSQRYSAKEVQNACKRCLPAQLLEKLIIFRPEHS